MRNIVLLFMFDNRASQTLHQKHVQRPAKYPASGGDELDDYPEAESAEKRSLQWNQARNDKFL